MSSNTNIDFVLPWVDSSNPLWREHFQSYKAVNGDNSEIRFRNWDLLRYWFRSIEKFAPWFRKIHFITSGELPDWLNIGHPQLNWVKHEDYIPKEYLPTFSANTIELNLHRINGLSDRFVYFNDDLFLTKSVASSRFFKNDLPCDFGVMSAKPVSGGIIHIAINNLEVLEKHFDKHTAMKKNLCKWFNCKYGSKIFNNILLYPWTEFSGFVDPHMPNAFLKSTFDKIWKAEAEILAQTCTAKFRTNADVNQWLMRYWQLAEGSFYAKNTNKNTLCIDINDSNNEQICNAITKQIYEIICINDSADIANFDNYKTKLQRSFELILPQKSSFEK